MEGLLEDSTPPAEMCAGIGEDPFDHLSAGSKGAHLSVISVKAIIGLGP